MPLYNVTLVPPTEMWDYVPCPWIWVCLWILRPVEDSRSDWSHERQHSFCLSAGALVFANLSCHVRNLTLRPHCRKFGPHERSRVGTQVDSLSCFHQHPTSTAGHVDEDSSKWFQPLAVTPDTMQQKWALSFVPFLNLGPTESMNLIQCLFYAVDFGVLHQAVITGLHTSKSMVEVNSKTWWKFTGHPQILSHPIVGDTVQDVPISMLTSSWAHCQAIIPSSLVFRRGCMLISCRWNVGRSDVHHLWAQVSERGLPFSPSWFSFPSEPDELQKIQRRPLSP